MPPKKDTISRIRTEHVLPASFCCSQEQKFKRRIEECTEEVKAGPAASKAVTPWNLVAIGMGGVKTLEILALWRVSGHLCSFFTARARLEAQGTLGCHTYHQWICLACKEQSSEAIDQ